MWVSVKTECGVRRRVVHSLLYFVGKVCAIGEGSGPNVAADDKLSAAALGQSLAGTVVPGAALQSGVTSSKPSGGISLTTSSDHVTASLHGATGAPFMRGGGVPPGTASLQSASGALLSVLDGGVPPSITSLRMAPGALIGGEPPSTSSQQNMPGGSLQPCVPESSLLFSTPSKGTNMNYGEYKTV